MYTDRITGPLGTLPNANGCAAHSITQLVQSTHARAAVRRAIFSDIRARRMGCILFPVHSRTRDGGDGEHQQQKQQGAPKCPAGLRDRGARTHRAATG